MIVHNHEAALAAFLRDLPYNHEYRFNTEADKHLRQRLFQSLVGNDALALPLLFPGGPPKDPAITWSLRKAQGAVEGAEYTEAARGNPCGHIFRSGESTYHCKTCAADDTCVLCARCFTESDHDGHEVFISVSPGNSGCCDCADDEAWKIPVHCSIHKAGAFTESKSAGKNAQSAGLPDALTRTVGMTIGRVLDFVCDVFSCSPEQLRLSKTDQSVKSDEKLSRLNPDRYGGEERIQEPMEYALVLWNDEKHTVDGVREQVARACQKSRSFGEQKAYEVDDVGRSIIHYATDVSALLGMARVIEQIKLSVTVRSSRDTFRERMCDTIIDWLSDIAGCSMGSDPHILRNTICAELLGRWQVGSQKFNVEVGQSGIHDHEAEDRKKAHQSWIQFFRPLQTVATLVATGDVDDDEGDEEMGDDDDDEIDVNDAEAEAVVEQLLGPNRVGRGDFEILGLQPMDVEVEDDNVVVVPRGDMEVDMDEETEDTANEVQEATLAGYPPPPPPPPPGGPEHSRQVSVAADDQSTMVFTPQESDEGEPVQQQVTKSRSTVPRTPRNNRRQRKLQPPNYWLDRPVESLSHNDRPLAEDLRERLRLDHLILYDLRLWKTLRVNLRHLYISTVVTVVEFKRILGLRFAGLYTMLSQLYLIADREPDHSIINLSVQLLTTPSITAEVVDRANFLTNLMAILYTFLTTRQVGHPKDVSPTATLAFDAGAITNRRMFHFFVDVRYMFQSTFVRERIRTEPQYLLQFLDLVKLHQGICPNIRAVGEHVEYETEAWFSAQMITKEINRLCRLVAEAYLSATGQPDHLNQLIPAIKTVGQAAMISSLGLEWQRFTTSEMKSEVSFRKVTGLTSQDSAITIPDSRVLNEPMSFHHPLHYLLSWLLQAGKELNSTQVQSLLLFDGGDLRASEFPSAVTAENGPFAPFVGAEDRLCALFDTPLRLCAWLAQMRASMWVRNGMTLRHQMHTYRGTSQRDVSYQRDLFLLQVGLVVCNSGNEAPGERFLAQIIDRFEMSEWVQGNYTPPAGFDVTQQVDVVEEFFHLMVVLISERDDLLLDSVGGKPSLRTMQREIAHVLCFKPLSYSDLSGRMTEKIADADTFDDVLKGMTKFRSPEGLNDSGTFELLPEYLDIIDPYYAFYTRNMREEADGIYRAHVAKRLKKDKADIVPEPKLAPITGCLFKDLTAFTSTGLFARAIGSTLGLASLKTEQRPEILDTRIESLLPIVLHLALIATIEDQSRDDDVNGDNSFVVQAFTERSGIMSLLQTLQKDKRYTSCHPRINAIIKRAQEKRPRLFLIHNIESSAIAGSPAPTQTDEDREAKKKASLARQARVMASFKEQQSSFLSTQGINWGVDTDDDEDTTMQGTAIESTETVRPYPADACMLCQEETNDDRLYGSFAFVSNSRILRRTPFEDSDFVQEVVHTPLDLDRSADAIRPFGVAAGVNSKKRNADGAIVDQEQQGLAKAFSYQQISLPKGDGSIEYSSAEGPVATSCGHIMHYSCFRAYTETTRRRHSQQIARNHPERLTQLEFLCPLCKALGNIFLPIMWKGKKETYPGALSAEKDFDAWMMDLLDKSEEQVEILYEGETLTTHVQDAQEYISTHFNSKLAPGVLNHKTEEATRSPVIASPTRQGPLQAITSLLTARLTSEAATSPDTASGPARSPSQELQEAYARIEESYMANKIWTSRSFPGSKPDQNKGAALADTLGYTISAVEIAHRGVAGYPVCLSSISEQNLTTLRVLSETVTSFVAVTSIEHRIPLGYESHEDMEMELLAALVGKNVKSLDDDPWAKLFCNDTFNYLTKYSVFFPKMWTTDGHHVMRICLTAELIKVSFEIFRMMYRSSSDFIDGFTDSSQNATSIEPGFADFFNFAHSLYLEDIDFTTPSPLSVGQIQFMTQMIQPYALTFLRKSLILLHVRSGVDFAVADAELDPSANELSRLLTLLRLPSLSDMLVQMTSSTPSGTATRTLASNWTRHYRSNPLYRSLYSVPHPAIPELVRLPRTYDTLTEEAIKRKCPTTGKEIQDPAICLFCGAIFCSQASCCRKNGQGGCTQHMPSCGGNVGLFMLVRKCTVLMLHNGHGSWECAPYLDKHGEVDPSLRRHHQLFLNQRRYDRLFRDLWLRHGIPSAISRRLEGDVNTGGWETL